MTWQPLLGAGNPHQASGQLTQEATATAAETWTCKGNILGYRTRLPISSLQPQHCSSSVPVTTALKHLVSARQNPEEWQTESLYFHIKQMSDDPLWVCKTSKSTRHHLKHQNHHICLENGSVLPLTYRCQSFPLPLVQLHLEKTQSSQRGRGYTPQL